MPEPELRFLETPQLRLSYWSWGSANRPPVLLIHGQFDHARGWDGLARGARRHIPGLRLRPARPRRFGMGRGRHLRRDGAAHRSRGRPRAHRPARPHRRSLHRGHDGTHRGRLLPGAHHPDRDHRGCRSTDRRCLRRAFPRPSQGVGATHAGPARAGVTCVFEPRRGGEAHGSRESTPVR